MNLDTALTPFTKTDSNWIIDLNAKYKTIKLRADNIGENLHDLGSGDSLLDTPSMTQSMKEMIDRLDLLESKNLRSGKGCQEN